MDDSQKNIELLKENFNEKLNKNNESLEALKAVSYTHLVVMCRET